MWNAALDLVARHLPPDGRIVAPGGGPGIPVAAERLDDGDLDRVPPGGAAAVLLVGDELSHAGVHAEELVDTAATALAPHGVLVATARNRVFAAAAGSPADGTRGYSAAEAAALLHHRGFTIDVLCAPGAAARLRGAADVDLDADRQPGLLDAAPRLLMIARAPRDAAERSHIFFRSRPRKIAAASTLCRDPDGRMLLVYDRFRRMWTIPGGVIDADEEPGAAARRETWEETGVKVDIGRLLGVFARLWPDRLIFVFEAQPAPMTHDPSPVHRHEIAEAVWTPPDEALERLAPEMGSMVRRCLDQPGFSWA